MKSDKKIGVKTVKGGIIEILTSLAVMIGALAIAIYDNSVSSTTRFQSRFVGYLLTFVVAFLCFVDGIVTIPLAIQRKKKNKNKETQNIEAATKEDDKDSKKE